VWTGADISPVFRLKAVLSKAGTVCPLEMVSLPPFAAEPGSFEYFFASFAKFAPAFSCA
jgi:hypothetical protein